MATRSDSASNTALRQSRSAMEVGVTSGIPAAMTVNGIEREDVSTSLESGRNDTSGGTAGVVTHAGSDVGGATGVPSYARSDVGADVDVLSGETVSLASSTSTKKIHHSVSFSLNPIVGGAVANAGNTGNSNDGDEDTNVAKHARLSPYDASSWTHDAAGGNKENDAAAGGGLSGSTPSSSRPASRSSSTTAGAAGGGGGGAVARSPSVTVANFIHCKLCLCDYPPREMVQLANCRCLFCADCLTT